MLNERMRRRADGIEFAVGWFLFAIGIGVLLPRPTGGLSAIQGTGYGELWAAWLIVTAASLISCSYFGCMKYRLASIVAAMICWISLAFVFVKASLWGATIQSCVAVCLLNTSAFSIITRLRKMK